MQSFRFVSDEEVLPPLPHVQPPDAALRAQQHVGLVRQLPAILQVCRLGQPVPHLPQPPQPGGLPQHPGIFLRVGGGGGNLHQAGHELSIGSAQALVDQDGVRGPPLAVQLPEGPEDAPVFRYPEVVLFHGHEDTAHHVPVDEHGPQHALFRRQQPLAENFFLFLAHKYVTPFPRRGPGLSGLPGGPPSSFRG